MDMRSDVSQNIASLIGLCKFYGVRLLSTAKIRLIAISMLSSGQGVSALRRSSSIEAKLTHLPKTGPPGR